MNFAVLFSRKSIRGIRNYAREIAPDVVGRDMSAPDTTSTCPHCHAALPTSNLRLHLIRCRPPLPSAPAAAPPRSHHLVGRRVRLRGLTSRSDLNGANGLVELFDAASGRYHVEVNGETVAVRPDVCEVLTADEVLAAGWPCRICTFVNDGMLDQCEMCDARRPAATTDDARHPATPMDAARSSDARGPDPAVFSDTIRYFQPLAVGSLFGGLTGAFLGAMRGHSILSAVATGASTGAAIAAMMNMSALQQEVRQAEQANAQVADMRAHREARHELVQQRLREFIAQLEAARSERRPPGAPPDDDEGANGSSGPLPLFGVPAATVAGLPGEIRQLLARMHSLDPEALTRMFGAGPAQPQLIARLPKHTYAPRAGGTVGGADDSAPSCSVCLEEYARGDELITLPCFHTFHTNCCEQWLQQSGSCPVCKHRVDARNDEFPMG